MIQADVSQPSAKKKFKPYFGGASRNSGGSLARFANHEPHANREYASLRADHVALTANTTQFPTRVFPAADVPRILVSGHNSAKVGKVISKGAWKGMPIYTLTLEERATCPSSCHLWRECYGNAMPMARRVANDKDFLPRLEQELWHLNWQHKKGFVLRLHVLGDFYSTDYAMQWMTWLDQIPALHAFGYTANLVDSDVGFWLAAANSKYLDRWVIRFSVAPDAPHAPRQATTIWRKPEAHVVPEGQICPVSLGKTDACSTCGLCWSPAAADTRIVFPGHGMNRSGNRKEGFDMPTGGSAPRVLTLAEREAMRGQSPLENGKASRTDIMQSIGSFKAAGPTPSPAPKPALAPAVPSSAKPETRVTAGFVFEKGIPLPAPKPPKTVYPFDQMEVGESFLIKDKRPANIGVAHAKVGKTLRRKFVAKAVEGGVRVWRTE